MQKNASFWTPKREFWKDSHAFDVINAYKENRLVLFTGNGVSRPSGVKSWSDLFKVDSLKNATSAHNVNLDDILSENAALTEIAGMLDNYQDVKNILNGILFDEFKDKRPNEIHNLCNALAPLRIFTANVDKIQEAATDFPYDHEKIIHIHGVLDNRNTWIFSDVKYRQNERKTIREITKLFTDGRYVLLFVGYGHSFEDFDIIQAIKRLNRKGCTITMYSLQAPSKTNAVLSVRLKRLGITMVPMDTPELHAGQDWVMGYAFPLLSIFREYKQLCDTEGVPPTRILAKEAAIKSIEDSLMAKVSIPRPNITVLGVSAVNRLSFAPENIDSTKKYPVHQRQNMPRDVFLEVGGSGLTAASVMWRTGCRVSIISKTAQDPDGRKIWDFLTQEKSHYEVFADHFERERPSKDSPLSRTWSSYVIIHPDDGQRNFLDQRVDYNFLSINLNDKAIDKVVKTINDSSIFYFDKFFRNTISVIFNHIDFNTWVVYETGEEGDRRWGRIDQRTGDRVPQPYTIEHTVDSKVDIVITAFRFATHYFGKTKGNGSGGYWDNEEISPQDEITWINEVTSSDAKVKEFAEIIYHGADKWLRKYPENPRFVVVTLHSKGAIWINLSSGHFSCGYVPGKSVKAVCTAGAGDTFRGAFCSLLGHYRERLASKPADVRSDEILERATQFAVEMASIRVVNQTLDSSLDKISEEWKNSSGRYLV